MEVLLRAQAILNFVRSSSDKKTTSFTVLSSVFFKLDTFHPLRYLPQLCHRDKYWHISNIGKLSILY